MYNFKLRTTMSKKSTLKDKLILEAIDFFKIDSLLDDDENDEDFSDENSITDFDTDDYNFDELEEDDDEYNEDDDDYDGPDRPYDDGDFALDDPEDFDEDFDEDSDENEMSSNENEGIIRTVRGAYMVFKRPTASNNYEELWIYNMTNVKSLTKIRNSILAGTDIDPISLLSSDGEQKATMYSKGNVQFLYIDGLPN